MSGKILVTPRSVTKNGHSSLDKLRSSGFDVVFCTPGQQPDEQELKTLLSECVGYLAGVEPVTASVFDTAKSVKVISRNGVGVNNIDPAVEQHGIKVCRTNGANARGVAELTMALILSLVRSIPSSDVAIKDGCWVRQKGIELENRTLGLIGFGRIGQLVSGFAVAFGMKVIVFDPYLPADFQAPENVSIVALGTVLRESDILSLHCPPSDRPVIGKEELAVMKCGAYLVNTARAELIDEAAVEAALDSGALAGFATDVFVTEPPSVLSLARHRGVIVTPHIGGFTAESVDRAMNAAVDNLLEALQ